MTETWLCCDCLAVSWDPSVASRLGIRRIPSIELLQLSWLEDIAHRSGFGARDCPHPLVLIEAEASTLLQGRANVSWQPHWTRSNRGNVQGSSSIHPNQRATQMRGGPIRHKLLREGKRQPERRRS
jgi:hypothetical protein